MVWRGLSIPLVLLSAVAAAAADPVKLKGTWVREMTLGQQMANQIALTFTDSRLTCRFTSGGRADNGQTGWITLEFDGDYAVTESGLCVGVVTGLNVDMTKVPSGDSSGDPFEKSMMKLIGEPFCFRARVVDGCLVMTDLRVPVEISEERYAVNTMACGKYRNCPDGKVELPKLSGPKSTDSGIIMMLGQLFGMTAKRPGSDEPLPVLPPTQAVPPVPVILAQTPPMMAPPAGTKPPPMVHPATAILPNPVPLQPLPMLPPTTPPVPMTNAPMPFPEWIPPAPKPMLDGTWYRDMILPDSAGAGQAVFTFKGDRLTVRLTECAYVEGQEKLKSGSFEFDCTYHRSADGYVVGRVIGVEVDLKNAPGDAAGDPDIFKGLSKSFGEPFCFRCELRDGQMILADLRLPMVGAGEDMRGFRDMASALIGGKYRKSETATVALPKFDRPKETGTSRPSPFIRTTPPQAVPCPPGQFCPPLSAAPPMPSSFNPPMVVGSGPIIPTAGQIAPPGSMRNEPMLPMIVEAWRRSALPPEPVAPPPIPIVR